MASRGLLQKKNVKIQFNHVSLCDPSMAESRQNCGKCDISPLGNQEQISSAWRLYPISHIFP